jgi:patatin-related protein
MATGSHQDRIELRLALVCYGGVSLAVYMHGIVKEVHQLVRASRTFDQMDDLEAANQFHDERTEAAYFEALRDLARKGRRLSVTVDIIAGTSAGGINGVVLGKVLACGGEQDQLRQLWVEQGDLRKLLRAWPVGGLRLRAALAVLSLLSRIRRPTSPLKGEVMSQLLVAAMRNIDNTRSQPTGLIPPGGSLDLYVTLTDLQGFEVLVPTGAGGASQRDREHAQVLHFSSTQGLEREFGATATPALSFAAEAGITYDAEAVAQHFMYRYDEAADPAGGVDEKTSAERAWFVDGGVLDNAPFDLVVAAISDKRAQTQVERRIVYIQPDPGRPLVAPAPSPADAARSDGAADAPSWLGGLGRAVVGVKGTHTVLRDLLRMRNLNLRIAEIGAITRSQMTTVTTSLDEVIDSLPSSHQRSWEITGQDEVELVAHRMRERAKAQLGTSFPTYCRLKVEAAARRLADEIANHFVYPPDASNSSFLRAVLGEWARGRDEWTDPDPTRLLALLGPVDIPYRERRLLFLLAGINELYTQADQGEGAPLRNDLNELKARAWDMLEELRRLPGEAVEELFRNNTRSLDFLSAEELHASRLAAPSVFVEDHAHDFEHLYTAYSGIIRDKLNKRRNDLWENYRKLTSDWDDEHRNRLLSRYLAFPFWDGLIFPTIALSQLPQFSPIGVAQFSPLNACALPVPAGGKLKGAALHHFAGFVKAERRENDYLWGRLDGVELLLRQLYDAASTSSQAADTAPPPSAGEAVARAGGAVLQKGLRAVLASESGLHRITQTMQGIAKNIDALLRC